MSLYESYSANSQWCRLQAFRQLINGNTYSLNRKESIVLSVDYPKNREWYWVHAMWQVIKSIWCTQGEG